MIHILKPLFEILGYLQGCSRINAAIVKIKSALSLLKYH